MKKLDRLGAAAVELARSEWKIWTALRRRSNPTNGATLESHSVAGQLAVEVGLAAIGAQQSQVEVLDNKLALGSTVAVALVGLLPATVSLSDLSPWERLAWAAAEIIFLLALAHGVRGMWVRKFDSTPKQDELRKLAADAAKWRWSEEQLRWRVAESLEEAVVGNEPRMAAKTSAFRITWLLISAGLVAAVALLWASET